MKEIKNFLSKEEHKEILNLFSSNSFPWYFSVAQAPIYNKQDKWFFYHNIFIDGKINSSCYQSHILCLVKKVKVNILSNIRANLIIKSNKKEYSNFHTDTNFKCNTAIYYINTNNGYTEFENNKKIKSESNKIVFFDSNLKHRAVSQTDEDFRFVLNINYE